jgi:Dolichyl-phosphate-mannose-protein mannosyltransferase
MSPDTSRSKNQPETRPNVWEVLPFPVAFCVFFAIGLHQLHLPGLYYDEALDLTPMLELMAGQPVELLRGIGLGGRPIMLLDYMGSLGGYVTVPFLTLFGPGVEAARLQPLFFSGVSLLLVWLLARRWFGPAVAGFTVILLAAQPSFIWFSRQGISVTSVMTALAWGGLLALDVARTRIAADRHRPTALAAGLLLGLGLWAKLPFLWWLMMLAVMTAVFVIRAPRARMRVLLRLTPWVGGGFLLGNAPMLYYNVQGLIREGNPYTAGLIFASLLNPTQQFGVNNLDFLNNLTTSWTNFRVFIDGSYFWYNGITFSNVYALPALALALGAGALLVWRQPERWRWLALALALPVAVFMGSFTVSGQWATHFFIISGLPQILLACAAVWLGRVLTQFSPRRMPRPAALAAAAALLVLPFSRDVWVSQQHHQKLAETGGSGRFSDAVYTLSAYLDAQKLSRPAALDWGIEKQVRLLTGDRVRPIEIFGYSTEPDEAFRARVRELLQDPQMTYIVLWDRFAVYNRRAEFTRLAAEAGKTVNERFIAHERSGLPVYVVLEAR